MAADSFCFVCYSFGGVGEEEGAKIKGEREAVR